MFVGAEVGRGNSTEGILEGCVVGSNVGCDEGNLDGPETGCPVG